MSAVGLFVYLLTEGFVPYVENKFIEGWRNIDFIGRHMDEDSPEIQYLLDNYEGLYYQWDMGIQCKYEAGTAIIGRNICFWTTLNTLENVDFFRVYFRDKGQLIVKKEDVMKYWDGWPENSFKKYATIRLFDYNMDEGRKISNCVGYTKEGKIVPLNFTGW